MFCCPCIPQIRKDSFITHRAFCDALAEESAMRTTITTVPSAFTNLRNDHLMMSMNNHHQTPRIIPEIFPGFHPDQFGGNNSEGALGNFGLLNNLNSRFPDLVQGMDMFGTSTHHHHETQQWVNVNRFPEKSADSSLTTSANNVNMCCVPGIVPHGLKQEPEENKLELSHRIGALYSCHQIQNPQQAVVGGGANHMSATALLQKAAQIGSTTTNNNNNVVNNTISSSFVNSINHLGLMGSAVLNFSNCNINNVDVHKIFKQTDNKSTNLGGGFASTITAVKGLRSSSNEEELGLTRDFLGVGGDSLSGPFLEQELAKFNNTIGSPSSASALDLSQYGGHH